MFGISEQTFFLPMQKPRLEACTLGMSKGYENHGRNQSVNQPEVFQAQPLVASLWDPNMIDTEQELELYGKQVTYKA